jgi:DNA-binding HxlR family transcriptional regulator
LARAYHQICPIARTLDVLGDRWTLLIVRDLMLGARKFKDFLEASPSIPTRVLAARLKMLEAEGIVERVPYSARPPRDEYHLTDVGRSLRPLMDVMLRWGMEHRLSARQRRIVLRHLYGEDADSNANLATLTLPERYEPAGRPASRAVS